MSGNLGVSSLCEAFHRSAAINPDGVALRTPGGAVEITWLEYADRVLKTFRILPVDWLPGGDELTPTMKLKHKPIGEKYAAEIEALYSEGGSSR